MNIPIVLGVIIGLVFIYLVLSLLASEIQELASIILQWRGAHLKKSIEVLIAGNPDVRQDQTEFKKVRKLVNNLYENPLIKNLNHKAQGPLERLFRQGISKIGTLGRRLSNTENLFGEASTAPSYIPSEAFASSLIETLKISPLIQAISETRFEKFKDKKLKEIEDLLKGLKCDDNTEKSLDKEFQSLKDEFDRIVEDYKQGRSLLNNSLDRMSARVDLFVKNCQTYLPASESSAKEFLNKIKSIGEFFESKLEREVLLSEIRPSFTNLLNIIRQVAKTEETAKEVLANKEEPIEREIKEAIDDLPDPLKESLYMLANRAESKAKETGEVLDRFQQEVEVWFDNAMERASGVYKRNAKGVAIILGILIAVSVNADTFYIVENLSQNSFLLATINEYAEQLVSTESVITPDSLADIQKEVNSALKKIPLPIGWQDRSTIGANPDGPVWLGVVKRMFGWLLTGLAISMGSSFWFSLLQKLVGIRNAGGKPGSPSERGDK